MKELPGFTASMIAPVTSPPRNAATRNATNPEPAARRIPPTLRIDRTAATISQISAISGPMSRYAPHAVAPNGASSAPTMAAATLTLRIVQPKLREVAGAVEGTGGGIITLGDCGATGHDGFGVGAGADWPGKLVGAG